MRRPSDLVVFFVGLVGALLGAVVASCKTPEGRI